MTFLEVLCEGTSDVPTICEVLTRHFGLCQHEQFRVHPHRGKGALPKTGTARPAAYRDELLTQLPIKLRNYGRQTSREYRTGVLVLVDADNDKCEQLKADLVAMYNALDVRPANTLFRIAVEETESWFLADPGAVRKAYPRVKQDKLTRFGADSICGAWERLAEALGLDPGRCSGADKTQWARAISPHLNFSNTTSPSLAAFVSGLAKLLGPASD